MMAINLSSEAEQLIEQRMASGRYHSANEVVILALRLLEEQDASLNTELEEIRAKIAAGVKELDEGKGIELTDDVFESLLQRVRDKSTSTDRMN